MKKFFSGLLNENPIFVLCLGLCPALAVTTTFEKGYIMGLSVLIIILLSNTVISLISRFIDENIRVPAYIMIIATFVTILDLLIGTYIPALSKVLGVYIPLIVVNCIVLGRALSFATRNSAGKSMLDALKIGFGYMLALALIGLIREFLGSNTITIMDQISSLTGYIAKYQILPPNDFAPNQLFLTPAGAFLTLGLILGIINIFRKGDTK
jgi:electron transport complex protein RnfE